MNKDIRVVIGFFDHRKTRKLISKFGLEAAWGLLRLWVFAAVSRPDGFLSNMSDEDIAMECHMEGKCTPSELVAYLKSDDCKWIDDTENGAYLHDWHIHNPWAAKAEDRSDKSRFLRLASTHRSIYNTLVAQGVNALSRPEYDRITACQRAVGPTLSPAPVPAPVPVPDPKSKDMDKTEKRFVRPTVEEVRAYCLERKNSVVPEKFMAHYESNGWKVGKNPMKSWKAAIVSTWESNNPGGNYDQGKRNAGDGNGKSATGIKPAAGEYASVKHLEPVGD